MIKIVVCEDIKKMQDIVVSGINAEADMEVVGVASSEADVIDIANKTNPDIILMDITLDAEKSGISATKTIMEKHPEVKIIMLTAYGEPELIIDAYYAGAVDYIIKSSSLEPLFTHIRDVYEKSDFLGPLIVQNLHSELAKYKIMHESLLFFINSFSHLTPTEKTVLKELYYGKTRQQLAEDHYLSITTVHTHVKHILKKLGFTSTKVLLAFLKKIQLFENFKI